MIEDIDRRHLTYKQNIQEVFDLEKEGKAFVFAPSEPFKVGTYSMDEETERKLYDLGMKDFASQQGGLEGVSGKIGCGSQGVSRQRSLL